MAQVELTKDLFHKDDLILFIGPDGQVIMDYVQDIDTKVDDTIVYGVKCNSHDISFNGGVQVWTVNSRNEMDYPYPSKEKILRVYHRGSGTRYFEIYPRDICKEAIDNFVKDLKKESGE
jgi:hypothetical protein